MPQDSLTNEPPAGIDESIILPYFVKFFVPDSELTKWLNTGMRAVWFQQAGYSGVFGLLYWINYWRG